MKCPNCGFEATEGPCPRCGAVLAVAPPASFGKRHPVLLISVTLAVFLSIVGTIGLAAYRMVKIRPSSDQSQSQPQGQDEASSDEPDGLPVEHGRLARRAELHAHGKLYFVPVGKQAIPVQSLADYYRQKLGIELTVLPPVEIRPSDCVPERHQCIAQELQAEMTTTYAEIARNPDSVMIALTDEDIFPRDLDWEFTYSWHSARFGIISTHRLDPAFWGDAPSDDERLASTRQVLTKYVAMQYFHVPDSYDPSSVMYTPLTPNGGSDNIYQSDLHPEESVNGRRGMPFPCLFFKYSYKTHRITPDEPFLADCRYSNPAHADDETFTTNLGGGELIQRSLDLQLDSVPGIEFRRGYNSGYRQPVDFGLGWGVNHTYNSWLSSDGLNALTFIEVNDEAGEAHRFTRTDKGRGFNPNAIYKSDEASTYGARLKNSAGLYKLQYRDGAASTYLPCNSAMPRCYWIGYQDGQGKALRFDRSPNQELHKLISGDNQGIDFKYDDQHRIKSMAATNGKRVLYEYDAEGCLARVRRTDGQIVLYQYDSAHRMTSFSVARGPGRLPEKILSNQYDAQGRLIQQTLAGVGVFKVDYLATSGVGDNKHASELSITNPAGQIWKISISEDEYLVRAAAIRFPQAVKGE
jgi:YD repeat-containing protein